MSNTFLNAERNDTFSFLRGIDLQDLLVETENCMLEYRDKLYLPIHVTFGVEIEYEKILKSKTDKFIKENLDNWRSKSDGSLKSGGEITSPIMADAMRYWQDLKKVCDYLSEKNADTLHNAGGHIHVGAHVLGEKLASWRQFLKLYSAYENVLLRFVYGDKISGRKNIFKYAPPLSDLLKKEMPRIDSVRYLFDIRQILPTDIKYAAINFSNVDFGTLSGRDYDNTLEFRSPNSTTSEIIWQNNINAFTKMLVASSFQVMDEEFLDYKLNHEFISYAKNPHLYNNVNLKNALEFVDLVFDNNLDKIYFLRQYLKDFQENYGIKTVVRARKFVK